MRVITGSARGRKLVTLEGNDVRPTTDRVKEGIFSSIQFEVENSDVLDLFSGSGQLGIEALSRGANSVTFVDNSKKSLDIVRQNLEITNFTDKAEIHNMNCLDYLKTCNKKYDYIFLDPPYSKGILLEILPYLGEKINNNGKIFCEHEQKLVLPDEINKLRLKKIYKYGKIKVSLYRISEED